MAKIAFCDDDVSVLAEMQRLMEQYCAERDCKIEYNIFNHPFDLVAEIEKGNRYDILFMELKRQRRYENTIKTSRSYLSLRPLSLRCSLTL